MRGDHREVVCSSGVSEGEAQSHEGISTNRVLEDLAPRGEERSWRAAAKANELQRDVRGGCGIGKMRTHSSNALKERPTP